MRAGAAAPQADRARAVFRLADILEVFAGLEADRPARRNADLFASSWIPSDAALARLDLENPKAAELDSLAPLHGQAHRIEDRVDGHLSLHLGDVGDFRNLVYDVDLDHA